MGFGVPVDHWLRGPLCEWAEDLLLEAVQPGPDPGALEGPSTEPRKLAIFPLDRHMMQAWLADYWRIPRAGMRTRRTHLRLLKAPHI
jgi:asparagine synthase (glutamine-hydrolysing)